MKEIPDQFIAHIVELGFDKKYAALLYKSQDDWLGMKSGGRTLCTERGCKFSTQLSSDALFEHCRTVHGWRDYPCPHDNCQFVAYSKTSSNGHLANFHATYRTHNGNYFSCPRPSCKAAFASNADLIRHERIHSNDVFRCVICPYVSARQMDLRIHQRMHFNTRDYVCSECHKAFVTLGKLNKHNELHDNESNTQCPLCDRVDIKQRIYFHLIKKHNVKGVHWDSSKKHYIVPQQIQSHR